MYDQLRYNSLLAWWGGNGVTFWVSSIINLLVPADLRSMCQLPTLSQLLPPGGGLSICKPAQGYGSGYYL